MSSDPFGDHQSNTLLGPKANLPINPTPDTPHAIPNSQYPAPASPSFTAVARYYDLLMRDVPYRAWVRYLHQLLESHAFEPHRILDVACGTGTVAEMLARQGYEVAGIDISP